MKQVLSQEQRKLKQHEVNIKLNKNKAIAQKK
jgi:hypothetical protein